MPDRTDVTYKVNNDSITTHGYWFTWTSNGEFKAMGAKAPQSATSKYANTEIVGFNYASSSYKQQWIIISEDELPRWKEINDPTGIGGVKSEKVETDEPRKYIEGGNLIISKDGKKFLSSGQRLK